MTEVRNIVIGKSGIPSLTNAVALMIVINAFENKKAGATPQEMQLRL